MKLIFPSFQSQTCEVPDRAAEAQAFMRAVIDSHPDREAALAQGMDIEDTFKTLLVWDFDREILQYLAAS